jgi:hypothetical protein
MTRNASESMPTTRPESNATRPGGSEKRQRERRSGDDRRMFPRPEGRRAGDGRRRDDEG